VSRSRKARPWELPEFFRRSVSVSSFGESRCTRPAWKEEFWKRGLRKALTEKDEALRDLAAAARWVDRSFGKEEGFGQAHRALLKALDKASVFV